MPKVVSEAQASADHALCGSEKPSYPNFSAGSILGLSGSLSRMLAAETQILLIDDDPVERKLFTAALNVCPWGAHNVLCVDQAAEAVEICSSTQLTAIFINTSLRRIGLTDLMSSIRGGLSEAGNEDCPVIGRSSKEIVEDFGLCHELEMTGLLPRVAPREISEVIFWLLFGCHENKEYPFRSVLQLSEWAREYNRTKAYRGL